MWPWDGLKFVHAYTPATDHWIKKAELITGRKYFSGCALNGKIYVFGGSKGHVDDNQISGVEEYDPVTDTWKKVTDMPLKTVAPAVVSYKNKIYVSGGNSDGPPSVSTVLPTLHEYTPLTN